MARPPRTNSKTFFLTYSQIDDDDAFIETLCDDLYALQPTPVYIEAAHERHQDGGHHFHVVIGYSDRLLRNLDYFDWAGYHPNIQGCRTADIYNRRHYLRKGERSKEEEHTPAAHKTTECDYDYVPTIRGTPPPYGLSGKVTWGDLVNDSATEAEFLDGVKSAFPREWVLRHEQIIGYARMYYHKAPPFEPRFSEESLDIPQEVVDWVDSCIEDVSGARLHVHLFVVLSCGYSFSTL